uniref:Uncharacterized protein n=1 Tax=Anguilla anguilla TaxID=7936 RepID=A0A0E9XBH2_ANGAN
MKGREERKAELMQRHKPMTAPGQNQIITTTTMEAIIRVGLLLQKLKKILLQRFLKARKLRNHVRQGRKMLQMAQIHRRIPALLLLNQRKLTEPPLLT